MIQIKSDSRKHFGVAVAVKSQQFAFGDTEREAISKLTAKILVKSPSETFLVESWHDGVYVPLDEYNPEVIPPWLARNWK